MSSSHAVAPVSIFAGEVHGEVVLPTIITGAGHRKAEKHKTTRRAAGTPAGLRSLEHSLGCTRVQRKRNLWLVLDRTRKSR